MPSTKLNIDQVNPVEDLSDVILHLGSQCLFLDDELRFIGSNVSGDQNVFHMPSSFLEGRLAGDLLIDSTFKASVLRLLEDTLKSKGVHLLKSSFGHTSAIAYSPKNVSRVYLVSFENNEQAELMKWFSQHSNFVACLSRSGDITFHNDRFFPSFDNISNLLDVIFEGDRQLVESTLQRVFLDNKAMKCQALLNGYGQHNWVEISLIPMNSPGKKCWVEIKNISELKDLEFSNRTNLKIYSEVLEVLDKVIIVSNQEGNVVYQNKQSTQLFGKQFCHLIDLAHHTSGKWFKMDGKSPINAFELPFGGFAADLDENIEYEYLFQLDSDQNIPLQIKVNRNGAFEAKDVLYVWNFSDISESYYTSMKLEETNKHLDNFVRATAHDLKSPVTNIMNLFNLMDKFEDQDKKDMVLSKIKASAEKLDDLLGGLMEMVDAQGNKQINIEELNFNEVMEFVISECNLDGLADKVRIVSNFHVEKIVYNKAYLRSIFLNLINNAIKYRDESRLCEITISTQLHGDEVVLKVADTGSGIDLDKHQDNLFKPFKRLTAKGSGKGIGLNLIKNFVEKNGGHVFVESKVGEGTTFACVLVPYPNNDLQTSMF